MKQLEMSSSWHCVTTLSIEVPPQSDMRADELIVSLFLF